MENEVNKRPKPVVLVVLDGWGISPPYSGNAISLANTPNFDEFILKYPATTLQASGESVGLPWGEPGNSEVGHVNLGLGRIIYQDLPKINKSIENGNFYKNKMLLKAIQHSLDNNSSLHLMGLVSDGCVHADIAHLVALLELASIHKLEKVYIHIFLDGRDTPYNSGKKFVKKVLRVVNEKKVGKICTISGRFYSMDRNNNWERTKKAYDAMTAGLGNKYSDPVEAIEASYKNKIYDEEFVPSVILDKNAPIAKVGDNDSVIFFNYRPDRARQLTKAFVLDDFDKFERAKLNNIEFVTFTEYEKNLPVDISFPTEEKLNSLGEILSKAGLHQLRIAETEKYAHVTYFFNGGAENNFVNEDHVLIPSPDVSSYDLKPEMSAPEVTNRLLSDIEADKHDFILVNYANADMVGHTANINAGIKAVEEIDSDLGKIVKSTLRKNGVVLITADHGNADNMFNMQSGTKDKEHSVNPVPFLLIGNEYEGKTFGWQEVPGIDLSITKPQGLLSDVAPTILKILCIEKPREMTGESLI